MLNWLRRFGIFAYLDNNAYLNLLNRYELLVGTSAQNRYHSTMEIAADFGKKWLFGHLNYDVKNQLFQGLKSEHPAFFDNEAIHFFEAGIVAYIPFGTNTLHIQSQELEPEIIFQEIIDCDAFIKTEQKFLVPKFEKIVDWPQYKLALEAVQEHIRKGDCYELNLCVGAVAQDTTIDIFDTFHKLNIINPAPFTTLYKNEHWHALSSSPERFLAKYGIQLLAQPMKGTIKRAKDPIEDEQLKIQLQNDPKERAENVMITDLMRNDLAQSCKVGTIAVPELFSVYSFPTLHTMISSVTGQLREDVNGFDTLLKAFPMGSMTGAPKKIVMEIIETLEQSKRELYAGCMGYCNPDGDFDFNVVIRTLLYNAATQTLSYHTGGAITIDSIAEKEWQEVQLKALALEKVFAHE